jgi:predicted transcriptional regulator
MKKKVLDLDTRRDIYNLICKNPGLHLREIERQLKMSSPLALYHLRFLERYEIITSLEERGYKRYYPGPFKEAVSGIENESKGRGNEKIPGYSEKKVLGLLREKTPLGIVLYILSSDGPVEHKTLHKNLKVPKSTLTYHISKLIKLGIIEKIEKDKLKGYDVIDRPQISKLLVTYKPTSNLIEEYGKMWTGLFGDNY